MAEDRPLAARDAGACFATQRPMLAVADALRLLRERTHPVVGLETVPLERASGRVLAATLQSRRPVPAFDNVAVDGYAFAGAALAPHGPCRLQLRQGRAAAGHPFAGELALGEAVQAFTGAPMPRGADTVVMWEEAALEGEEVIVPAGFRPGANRRRAGEDVAAGQCLFAAGLRLAPQHVAVAAELGEAELPVFKELRVGLLSSGDELREPGGELALGDVFDANRHLLKALLANLPVRATDLGILPDDRTTTLHSLRAAAAEQDLLISSGGASKGEEDHVVAAVADEGALDFWQIRMKPGRPLAVGRLDGAAFIGLPGNPVAAFVCFLLFARPVVLRMAGAFWPEPRAFEVTAGFAMRRRPGRQELLRARLARDRERGWLAMRIEREGSGILTSLTEADGLIEVPEASGPIAPGDKVRFYSFAEFGLPC